MNILLKAALATLLASGATLGASQIALAKDAPVVAGLGVANLDAIIANSSAFKTAQQQRPTTYKAQIDAAEARRTAIAAQLRPMVERFNRESQAATASTPAGQSSLQQQAQAIQSIQQSGQQELQRLLQPVALSEAYVQEQITDKLDAAVQAAANKRGMSLVVSPQGVIFANNAYNLNQDILNELNAAIPSAQLVPPAGWQPREVREQQAAQAGRAPAAGAPAAPAAPARPQTGGR